MDYSGIYKDGWVQKTAGVVLAGGRAANLIIRADVLFRPGQRLEVLVNGTPVAAEDVRPGPLDLRIPVPESSGPRNVELHWAGTTTLGENDPREAAALLRFLDVTPHRPAPLALRLPSALTDPNLDYEGIYKDGWVQKHAWVTLAEGPAAQLVVRAEVPSRTGQALALTVDGREVASESVQPGSLDLQVSLPASESERRIGLRWAADGPVGRKDTRRAAALLQFIGIPVGGAPTAVSAFPEDLTDPRLQHGGFDADGWIEKKAYVVLAGGPEAVLVIRGDSPAEAGQRSDVIVDGLTLASEDVPPGRLHFRIPLAASTSERRIELRWAVEGPVGPNDSRRAAAHIDFVGITAGQAPAALHRLPDDLTRLNVEYSGIYDDGWLEQNAWVMLAEGAVSDLVLTAQVLPQKGQHLDVVVDGSTVASHEAASSVLELRIPIPASVSNRRIELRWAGTAPISALDPRQAAARLTFLGLAAGGRAQS